MEKREYKDEKRISLIVFNKNTLSPLEREKEKSLTVPGSGKLHGRNACGGGYNASHQFFLGAHLQVQGWVKERKREGMKERLRPKKPSSLVRGINIRKQMKRDFGRENQAGARMVSNKCGRVMGKQRGGKKSRGNRSQCRHFNWGVQERKNSWLLLELPGSGRT